MGMEVVWIRLYHTVPWPYRLLLCGDSCFLPFGHFRRVAGVSLCGAVQPRPREQARLDFSGAAWGIAPFDVRQPRPANGFLSRLPRRDAGVGRNRISHTPAGGSLVGRDPDRAGRAYAVNVVGCIVGPLVSGFILLPLVGEHVSLLVFVLPWFVMAVPNRRAGSLSLATRAATAVILVAAISIFFRTKDYETQFPRREVLRDSTATVIAAELPTGRGWQSNFWSTGSV